VLTVWSVLAPMRWTHFNYLSVDDFGRSIESKAMCSVPVGKELTVYLCISVLVVLNTVSVSLAAYQSYLCRKVKLQFNESGQVFVVLMSILQLCVIGVPVFLTVTGIPSAKFAVYSLLVSILCASILLPLFGPKLQAIRKDMRRKAAKKTGRPISNQSASHGAVIMSRASVARDKRRQSSTFSNGSSAKAVNPTQILQLTIIAEKEVTRKLKEERQRLDDELFALTKEQNRMVDMRSTHFSLDTTQIPSTHDDEERVKRANVWENSMCPDGDIKAADFGESTQSLPLTHVVSALNEEKVDELHKQELQQPSEVSETELNLRALMARQFSSAAAAKVVEILETAPMALEDDEINSDDLQAEINFDGDDSDEDDETRAAKIAMIREQNKKASSLNFLLRQYDFDNVEDA